jgi:hypothetical protein
VKIALFPDDESSFIRTSIAAGDLVYSDAALERSPAGWNITGVGEVVGAFGEASTVWPMASLRLPW